MSFEDSDDDFNYDSDKVDEEVEVHLYGAVFFDPQLSNTDKPSADTSANSSENVIKQLGIPEHNASISSAVAISSFQDDLSAESDCFSIRNGPMDESDDQTTNSTTCSSQNSGSTPSHNGLPHFTLDSSESFDEGSQATEDWNASDVVIGVSKHSRSTVCNADDCEAIARKLARTRSDPSLWRVSGADRFSTPQTKRSARYFDDSFCSNCRQKGHLTSSCQRSGPVCILCGDEGHERDGCPNVYCYVCYSFGHSKANCSLANTLRDSVCQRCGQQGHSSKLCTEIWRQYISTTEEGRPVRTPKRLQVRPRGCYNCGRRNHAAEDCLRRVFRSNIPGPLPNRRVRVYDKKDIYARLHRVMEKKAKKKMMLSGRKTKKREDNSSSSSKKKSRKKTVSDKVSKKATDRSQRRVEDPPTGSLTEEKERVEQHLFNCFSSRLRSDQAESAPTPSADTGTPAVVHEALSTPPARPRHRESQDGAAFVPLSGAPKLQASGHRSRSRAASRGAGARRHPTASRQSTFSWINQSMSLGQINDRPGDSISQAKPTRFAQAYASTSSSLSYHERWRRAAWRRHESPGRMKASKTCPSLLSLEADAFYSSRRSRKQQQQQQQRRRKRVREARSLPTDADGDKRARKASAGARQRKVFVPRGESTPREEVDPRRRRSLTPKSRKTDWLAFVNRSTDVDPWD